jgi:hypothetical protein
MYAIALAEWHVTPDYINENWTEELLALMFEKHAAYLRRINPEKDKTGQMSSDDFFEKYPHLKPERVVVKRRK